LVTGWILLMILVLTEKEEQSMRIELNPELTAVIKIVLYHLQRGGISFEDLVKKVDENYPNRGSSLVQDLVTIDFIDTSDPTKVSLKDS
jgi:hypothetical protein